MFHTTGHNALSAWYSVVKNKLLSLEDNNDDFFENESIYQLIIFPLFLAVDVCGHKTVKV